MKNLVCKACGNNENFTQTARVSEVWFCDKTGMMVEVLESYDADESGNFQCFKCDSWEVENKEVDV